MEVIGLDGKQYKINLAKYTKNNRKTSKFHSRVREIIKIIYPMNPILEEVHLPGCDSLYADFFLPRQRKIIECNGEQHYKYTHHFHGTKHNFYKGRARDRKKQEWCDLNDFQLITLSFEDNEDEWRRQIRM